MVRIYNRFEKETGYLLRPSAEQVIYKQKLNYDEPLPKAELKDGKSVITGRLLGYEKHYACLLYTS